MSRYYPQRNHEIIPKIPTRCTVEQYAKIVDEKNRQSENQQMQAERVIKQSELVIDATRTKTDQCKVESDYRIKERIQNIQFLSDEIANRKKLTTIEEDTVKTYCKRVINAIKFIKDLQEKNEKQQKLLNENGEAMVKLMNDPVDRELQHENSLLKCNREKLERTLMRLVEQSRLLRTILYALDGELLRKSTSLEIDKNNLDLRTNFETLQLNKSPSNGDPSVTTQAEWENLTENLLRDASTEIASSQQLRSFTDISLNHAIEEIQKKIEYTSDEFLKRIDDTQYGKTTLEAIQNQTQLKISDILKNLTELRTELDGKERFLALCKNRLENRAQRPGTELCRDRVQDSLIMEMHTLQETIHHLKHMIDQSTTAQRHLLHTKVQQDDEMNRLIHRLKVDQVDCMTIRDSIEFTPF